MSSKRTRDALNIIREFAKTPKRSLPTPRRVLVDSNGNEIAKMPRRISRTSVSKSLSQGSPRQVPVDSNSNEIAKTPRRISRTSVSKSVPQGSVSLGCNRPSKTPCQLQVSPDQGRNHLISSKLNEHHLSSESCAHRELKPIEKENIFMVNDEFAGKEDTPFKGKRFPERNASARKERIFSLLSRFQKRDNFIRSPALRIEIKDPMDGCGKRSKISVSKSSTESNKNQFQQCIRTDGQVGKKIDAPKRSTKSHIDKSDAAKSS